MVKKIERFTLADWPESAKTGDYFPWKPKGEARAEDVARKIWDKNAETIYDSEPNDEQRSSGMKKILDSWIWRLKKEEASEPNEVLERIRKNGPFPYVKLRKERKEVDLLWELTLANALSDVEGDCFEKRSLEQFGERYGDEVKSFAEKLGKKYASTAKSKEEKENVSAQFQNVVGKLEKIDSAVFRSWLVYFLKGARADLRNYRGLSPLCYFLRVSIFHQLSKDKRIEIEKEVREEKIKKGIKEGLKNNPPKYDDSNPLDILVHKYDVETVKKALLALKDKSEELFQVVFLYAYEDLEFSEIGFKLGYGANYETARKKAKRRWNVAVKLLRKYCEIEQKNRTEREQDENR